MTTAVGSGPFTFVREEWVPGSKVVYQEESRLQAEVRRTGRIREAKLAKVDRVEWIVIRTRTPRCRR